MDKEGASCSVPGSWSLHLNRSHFSDARAFLLSQHCPRAAATSKAGKCQLFPGKIRSRVSYFTRKTQRQRWQSYSRNAIQIPFLSLVQTWLSLPEKLIPSCSWAAKCDSCFQEALSVSFTEFDAAQTSLAQQRLSLTFTQTALDRNQCRIFPDIFTGCVHWGFLNAYMQNKKLLRFSNSNEDFPELSV